MASLNKVMFIGNLTADPEMRFIANGKAVLSFTLAVNDSYTRDGEKHETVEWVNCVAWEKPAELINQYSGKGDSLYVEGKMQTRSWDDTETGAKKYKTEIVVREFQFLGSKRRDDDQAAPQQRPVRQETQAATLARSTQQQPAQRTTARNNYNAGPDVEDSDLPF